MDGKTLRGTLGHTAADQRKMHQLALSETGSGVILKEQITGEKQNDLSIVSQFLNPTLVKGRILSADARPSQCAFCARVTRWKGHYVLIAKGNQSTLREDLQLFFSEPPLDCRDWRTARTVDKGHGRLEIRDRTLSVAGHSTHVPVQEDMHRTLACDVAGAFIAQGAQIDPADGLSASDRPALVVEAAEEVLECD